jgi:hypothetical protein
VVGRDAAVEELRSLFTWLAGEEEFRGRVRLVEAVPEPGTLGGWPEAVVVELTADRIRNTDLAGVGELVEQVAAVSGDGDAEGSREEIH